MRITKGIGSDAVAKLLGLSNRQLHHWDARGVIGPSGEPATGSGSRRRYLPDDLLWLLVAKELRSQSVGLDNIGKIINETRRAGVRLDCDHETRLAWSDDRVLAIETDPQRLVDAVVSASSSLIIHLGRLASTARTRHAEYRPATTQSLDIAGRRYRVVLTADDRGTTARCIGQGGASATGDTASAALEQLHAEILRLSGTGPAARKTPGAAAWGADW